MVRFEPFGWRASIAWKRVPGRPILRGSLSTRCLIAVGLYDKMHDVMDDWPAPNGVAGGLLWRRHGWSSTAAEPASWGGISGRTAVAGHLHGNEHRRQWAGLAPAGADG